MFFLFFLNVSLNFTLKSINRNLIFEALVRLQLFFSTVLSDTSLLRGVIRGFLRTKMATLKQ